MKHFVPWILLALSFGIGLFFLIQNNLETPLLAPSTIPVQVPTSVPIAYVTPVLPNSYVIPHKTQVFQTFNNCGPAALSMALEYHGISITQAELGAQLRPYQNQAGDNDDKSTTLEELAAEARKRGLVAYHLPSGTKDILKALVARDMPVIVRTWLAPGEDIGHYRVVRGYDDTQGVFIQDDSLQGANLSYSYEDLSRLWEAFSFEYLVIAQQTKQAEIEAILGENRDKNVAWQKAVELAKSKLAQNPDDIYSQFNLSVAEYHLGNFAESARAFEAVESRLPFRMLWYQIEPIQAYFELGNNQRVLELTENILNNENRAFSELYYLRARVFEREGNNSSAVQELERALLYNKNFEPANQMLQQLQ